MAKIASAGAEKRFRDNIDKNKVDINKERELYKQKTLGDGMTASERARKEGQLLVEGRFAQQLQEAQAQLATAKYGQNGDAIDAAQRRLTDLTTEIEAAKQATGDYFSQVYEQSQTAEQGWNVFWNKYQENGVTAAKVVEEAMGSVTKNLEDEFAKVFEGGAFDAKKMVDAILSDIARLLAKLAIADIGRILTGNGKTSGDILGSIFGAVQGGGGGGGGSGAGLIGSAMSWIGGLFAANGAAFTASGVKAFAKGGAFSNSIVRQPTLFRFADGVGMMGEAGEEAIMPLARDSQGRLGVRYEGREAPQRRGDSRVTTNNISVKVSVPNGDPAEIRRSGAAVSRQVAAAVAGSSRYR